MYLYNQCRTLDGTLWPLNELYTRRLSHKGSILYDTPTYNQQDRMPCEGVPNPMYVVHSEPQTPHP